LLQLALKEQIKTTIIIEVNKDIIFTIKLLNLLNL